MTELSAIISAGIARYQASLPDFARGPVADVEPAAPIITLTEERQIALCLRCELADCVGIENPRCPIRIEQRRVWRKAKEAPR